MSIICWTMLGSEDTKVIPATNEHRVAGEVIKTRKHTVQQYYERGVREGHPRISKTRGTEGFLSQSEVGVLTNE